jgi:hypothetical protein
MSSTGLWRRTAGIGAAILAVLSATLGSASCTVGGRDADVMGTGSPYASAPSKADGRRQDLVTLVDRLEAVHPDPYHGVSEAEFRAAIDRVSAKVESLTDDQFLVEIMRLVGLLSAEGLDGHSGVWPWDNADDLRRLPLRLWEFPEGLYITGGAPQYRDLVGTRISHVDGVPIATVLSTLEPLVPRDNPTTILMHRPIFFICVDVLAGLGLIAGTDRVTLTVLPPGQSARPAVVDAVDTKTFTAVMDGWEWLLPERPGTPATGHLNQPYHVEYLPARRTVYFRYNAVQPAGSTLADALRVAMRGKDVDRIVIDVRNNHGGDNTTYAAFVDYLASPEIDQPGRLFVLAGRLTFSAAGNFAAELADRAEHEVFVGEPTGGAPNQFGDHVAIELPHTGITVTSAKVWVEVSADDRPATGPDLPVPFTAAAYFAGRDPVLDAALTRSG